MCTYPSNRRKWYLAFKNVTFFWHVEKALTRIPKWEIDSMNEAFTKNAYSLATKKGGSQNERNLRRLRGDIQSLLNGRFFQKMYSVEHHAVTRNVKENFTPWSLTAIVNTSQMSLNTVLELYVSSLSQNVLQQYVRIGK